MRDVAECREDAAIVASTTEGPRTARALERHVYLMAPVRRPSGATA